MILFSVLIMRLYSLIRLLLSSCRISIAINRGVTELSFAPSSLNFMMADTCNSQCLMCGKDYHTSGSGRYLSLEEVRTIYCHLDMGQVVDVVYGGGGEPFLNPELGEIARYTRLHHPYVQHTVISNAIDFREGTLAALLESGTHFLLSINAANSATYRSVAGVDSFEHVVGNVRRLVEMRRHLRTPVVISLSMILMRQNIAELPAFIELAADLGVDAVKTLYARIYPPAYRAKHNRSAAMLPEDSLYYQQDESDRIVRVARHTAQRRNIVFKHEAPFASGNMCRIRQCREPWKSFFVNFNGDVYPCPASEVLFRPKIDFGVYRSGNVLRQHYKEFWNNRFWQALRKTNLAAGRDEIVPECSCCGNAISWEGPRSERVHVLDWTVAETSDLNL